LQNAGVPVLEVANEAGPRSPGDGNRIGVGRQNAGFESANRAAQRQVL